MPKYNNKLEKFQNLATGSRTFIRISPDMDLKSKADLKRLYDTFLSSKTTTRNYGESLSEEQQKGKVGEKSIV